MSGNRAARLVALGQLKAKESEEYAQPESPCPPINQKAFKRFRNSVLPTVMSAVDNGKRLKINVDTSHTNTSLMPPSELPPAQKNLKSAVDSNNNNKGLMLISPLNESAEKLESTPVNAEVTQNGPCANIPPKLLIGAICSDRVLTKSNHSSTSRNKGPDHCNARRELFKAEVLHRNKDSDTSFSNDRAGPDNPDNLICSPSDSSNAQDGTTTASKLLSKEGENNLTSTAAFSDDLLSNINCSLITDGHHADITNEPANIAQDVPESRDSFENNIHHDNNLKDLDGMAVSRLSSTCLTDNSFVTAVELHVQDAPDKEEFLSSNNVMEPDESQTNGNIQNEILGSGDAANISIVFTDESDVVLGDDTLSSLNLSNENVVVIPLDAPHDAFVDISNTDAALEEDAVVPIPLQAPVNHGAIGMINHDAAALEEGRDAPRPARVRNTDNWKRNQVKALKNAGLEHISLRGKEVKAAAIGPRCGAGCRRKCSDVSDKDRKQIFDNYYKQTDRTSKWRFISGYVRAAEIKRRTVVVHGDEDAKKKTSYQYYLPISNQSDIQVCQTMFINTIGITMQSVKTAIKKRTGKFGLVSPSKMGKKAKRTALNKLKDDSAKHHIERFPAVESHYCRKNTTIRYIDENLNKRKMYNMYVIECQGKNMKKNEIASLKRYREIFKKYKLRFYKPKKDQCSKCLAWKYKSANQRSPEGAEKMRVHLAQKELSYQLKDVDTKFVQSVENRKDVCVITCDLQKTMSTPKGENGEFYYKSKFTTYNFTVFVSGEQQGYCYTWDQTTGKKGCTEVTSCMWSFIQLQVAKGTKEIRVYSDNCAAQNKNQFLFSMYVMASVKFNIKIIHRYLESGHTLLQCDSMHARIENSMKNTDVFSPSQWVIAMKKAKVNNPKYVVKVMEQEELYDFTPLASHQIWGKLKTSQIREVVICGKNPGKINYKYFFDKESTEAQVIKPKKGRPVNWSTFVLKRKYHKMFPVRPDILKGLQDLCKSGAIPAEHASFYLDYLPSIDQQVGQVEDQPASDVSDVESEDDDISSGSEGSATEKSSDEEEQV